MKQYLVINKKLSRSGCEYILALQSWRIHASISSTRGCLTPPMNAERDIMREKMHGKQTGTRLGTRLLAYYDVTGIDRHIPPGHANRCPHGFALFCYIFFRIFPLVLMQPSYRSELLDWCHTPEICVCEHEQINMTSNVLSRLETKCPPFCKRHFHVQLKKSMFAVCFIFHWS